jgi:hypothetical protein
MFHLELRQGIQSVRAFNMNEQQLSARFLAPLLADQEFTYEGHDWTPRKVRIRIFDGPELQTYQLGMGRGWQEVERKYADVTEAVLEAARGRATAAPDQPATASYPATASHPVTASHPAPPTQPQDAVDPLRERLIGRLFAGPVPFDDVVKMAAELMPGTTADAQLVAAERAAVELLQAGGAQLTR